VWKIASIFERPFEEVESETIKYGDILVFGDGRNWRREEVCVH
jgi:hypothetical protein